MIVEVSSLYSLETLFEIEAMAWADDAVDRTALSRRSPADLPG